MSRIPVSSVRAARPDMSDETRVAMRTEFAKRDMSQAAYAHQPDEWVAYQVYMSNSSDVDLCAIQAAARDRIMRLSLQVWDYQTLCGEHSAIIDWLQKENAELRAQRDEWHEACRAAQLEADGSPG